MNRARTEEIKIHGLHPERQFKKKTTSRPPGSFFSNILLTVPSIPFQLLDSRFQNLHNIIIQQSHWFFLELRCLSHRLIDPPQPYINQHCRRRRKQHTRPPCQSSSQILAEILVDSWVDISIEGFKESQYFLQFPTVRMCTG